MKKTIAICLLSICLFSCKKDRCNDEKCDIQQTYLQNETKVTNSAGIWGTVSSMEGNCMPVVDPASTNCRHCPVQRIIKIYEYTLASQATPCGNSGIFFSNFSTQLVAQVEADADGFFQVNIPAGHYSIAVVEDGKLYANETDGMGGLCPITYSSGLQKVNLTMTYKAAF